ncbi:MAG: carbohydrate kinase [Ginsengibacter sp.]
MLDPEVKINFPVVCFGEILWDFLPQGKLAGGAPVNVAYHLKMLGKNPAIISRIGSDNLGKELIQFLKMKNLETGFIQLDEVNETGKVLVTIKENNEAEYQIVKPVAWDFIECRDELISLVEEGKYFVFGSLINRNKKSANTLFNYLEIAQKKVFDINLRPPYFDKKILKDLLEKTDLLKLNIAELHLLSKWFNEYKNDEDKIKWLQEKFRIETTIVTKGDTGAILYIQDSFYYHDGYAVNVKDTIGSGDSFLAAIISKLIDHATAEEALDFANALGAFVASCAGGCPEYTIENVMSLTKKNQN